MEPRKRYNRINTDESELIELIDADDNNCCDESCPKDILDLYTSDEFDEKTEKRRRAFLRNHSSRHVGKNNGWFILLFTIIIISWIIYILTWRDVHKLKEEMELEHHDGHSRYNKWWRSSTMFYIDVRMRILPPNTGIFDELISILNNLQHMGVNAIVLSAIGQLDSHHSAAVNYMSLDSSLGTLDELVYFLKELHSRNMKLVLEINPNESSDEHPWFSLSKEAISNNLTDKYANYYVWHPGVKKGNMNLPPNNWLNTKDESAWTYVDEVGQFYLHQHDSHKPDLNHRSNHVNDEFLNIMKYWIDLGIDGIYMRDVDILFEIDNLLLNEPKLKTSSNDENTYQSLDHKYTHDQREIHDHIAHWRELLNELMIKSSKDIMLAVDVEDDHADDVLQYYKSGVDAPINTVLTELSNQCDGLCLQSWLDKWLDNIHHRMTPFWALCKESGESLGRSSMYKRALIILQMMLPGSAFLQDNCEVDLVGIRNFPQMDDVTNESDMLIQLYYKLKFIREDAVVKNNEIKLNFVNEDIVSLTRGSIDKEPYFMAINLGKSPSSVNFSRISGFNYGNVAVFENSNVTAKTPSYVEGSLISLKDLKLYPGDAIIVKLNFILSDQKIT